MRYNLPRFQFRWGEYILNGKTLKVSEPRIPEPGPAGSSFMSAMQPKERPFTALLHPFFGRTLQDTGIPIEFLTFIACILYTMLYQLGRVRSKILRYSSCGSDTVPCTGTSNG